VNAAAAALPSASVAVQFTVVLPIAKTLPDSGEHETIGLGSRLSVVVTVKATSAPRGSVASTEIVSGSVRTGGVESLTIAMRPDRVVDRVREPEGAVRTQRNPAWITDARVGVVGDNPAGADPPD
jgi:hypothetical protein